MNDRSMQRLFFALWPDASTADALAGLAHEVAAESGGRATAAGTVHLTLAFLGDQPGRIAHELSVAAARISAPPFDLSLDRINCWRKSAIAWAGVSSVPPPLPQLHQAITRSLVICGREPDERPFAAHITLARHIATPVRRPLTPPLVWRVTGFALAASELAAEGARYRVLADWPLVADG